MISVLTPVSSVSYNILALLCCAALIPLALTKSPPPETPKGPRLRPMLAVRNSPLAAAGVVVAVMSCLASIFIGNYSTTAIFLTALIFGITTFPIFSVASAHAHDFVQSNERVELSAAFIFYYALGAIASPLLALFVMIASSHVLLIIFGLSRMRVRPTRTERTPYIYAPRTSFIIGRLLKRMRDKL